MPRAGERGIRVDHARRVDAPVLARRGCATSSTRPSCLPRKVNSLGHQVDRRQVARLGAGAAWAWRPRACRRECVKCARRAMSRPRGGCGTDTSPASSSAFTFADQPAGCGARAQRDVARRRPKASSVPTLTSRATGAKRRLRAGCGSLAAGEQRQPAIEVERRRASRTPACPGARAGGSAGRAAGESQTAVRCTDHRLALSPPLQLGARERAERDRDAVALAVADRNRYRRAAAALRRRFSRAAPAACSRRRAAATRR